MLNKICVLIILCTLVFAFSVQAGMFFDVPEEHWAVRYIETMSEQKVVNGYPDGSFKPSNTVTRAEIAKLLAVCGGLSGGSDTQSFSDVAVSEWYFQYIESVKHLFDTADRFYPDSPASRLDVVVAIVKLKRTDISSVSAEQYMSHFSDSSDIPFDKQAYVAAAIDSKLVTGYNDGTIKPYGSISRAEAVTLLHRAFVEKKEDMKALAVGLKSVSSMTMDNRSNTLYAVDDGWIMRLEIGSNQTKKLTHQTKLKTTVAGEQTEISGITMRYVYFDSLKGKIIALATGEQYVLDHVDNLVSNGFFILEYDVEDNFKPLSVFHARSIEEQLGLTQSDGKAAQLIPMAAAQISGDTFISCRLNIQNASSKANSVLIKLTDGSYEYAGDYKKGSWAAYNAGANAPKGLFAIEGKLYTFAQDGFYIFDPQNGGLKKTPLEESIQAVSGNSNIVADNSAVYVLDGVKINKIADIPGDVKQLCTDSNGSIIYYESNNKTINKLN